MASTAAANKPVREFVCRADAATTVAMDLTSFQVSCGSYRIPDAPCIGLGETYWRFLQAVGKAYPTDDVSIPFANYQSNSMIYAVDVEKTGEEAAFTGLNTQGNTLTLTVNNAWNFGGEAGQYNNAHEVYVYLVADQFLTIRGSQALTSLTKMMR